MFSPTCAKMCRDVIALLILLAAAGQVSAQSITDARRVEFTPSADHNKVDPASGNALLTKYTLNVYLSGTSTLVQTIDLGKPGPQPDGMIRLDFVALAATPLSIGVIYDAIVNAVGPGGTSSSARTNTFAFTSPCTWSIGTSSVNLNTSGASTGTVNLTAAAGCAWTAISNTPWITITSGTNGKGNGAVRYNVSANTATTSRRGTLTIAGNTFTVIEPAAGCTFTVLPTIVSSPQAGTSGTFTVTTQANCSWTTSSTAGWAQVTGSGNGTGTARYTIPANKSSRSRSAAFSIAGVGIAVSQGGSTSSGPLPAPANLRVVK